MNVASRTCLIGLGTALPLHRGRQETIGDFLLNVLHASRPGADRDRAIQLAGRVFHTSGIETRYSALPDFVQQNPAEFQFFPPRWDLEPFPSTKARMEVFETASVDLAERAARKAMESCAIVPADVTHLVLSTCTGFFAPGPDVALVHRLDLSPQVERLCIGFMGCYAGFNGLRVADSIVGANPDAVVLQVCVELCTLHFQKKPDPEFLVANCLFGDGAAAAVYATEGHSKDTSSDRQRGIARIVATQSSIAADSLDQMAWRIGDFGFEMRLSAAVPSTLREAAGAFVDALADRAGWRREDVVRWVLHPGGRRILEELEHGLELTAAQMEASFATLAEIGNVSSAAIFFVLEKALLGVGRGTGSGPLLALGFGPGLTIEGAALEVL